MDRSRIPSLDDLRALEAVVRTGSVRAAGDELSLTHGAVSRRVSKLARELGIPLLAAAGRGVRPTEGGAALAEATRQALRLIADRLDAIRRQGGGQLVLISCERSVAMRWLIPRLSRFQDAHPELAVHLSVGGGRVEFPHDGPAVAIRRLDFPVDPDWALVPLFPEETGPVMAPRLEPAFRAGGYLGLGTRTRPDGWAAWSALHPDAPMPREVRMLDHHFLIAEAAAAGMGVALCPRVVARDDVASKRLAAPLGFGKDGTSYVAILRPADRKSPLLAPVLDWLDAEAAEFRSPA